MTPIRHHLDSAELMSCASGSQPEALAAVISAHLSLCPQCRRELKMHSLIGETLFQSLKDEPLSIPSTMPAVSKSSALVPKVESTASDVQNTLRFVLAGQSNRLSWKRLSHGVYDSSLTPALSHGSLKLLKLEPNVPSINFHNTGAQMLLVLEGSLKMSSHVLGPGDVVHITPGKDDDFVTDPHSECVCLLASEKHITL